MREILFKAKTKGSNEWSEGLLKKDVKGNFRIQFNPHLVSIVINKDTICELIGLTNIHGEKVFEGDYFNDTAEEGLIMVVVWEQNLCHFTIDIRDLCNPKEPILKEGYTNVCDVFDILNYKIIGNIHDL